MVYCDLKTDEGIYIEGSTVEVAAECVFLMTQVYKRISEECNDYERARGVLLDMTKQAIYDGKIRDDITWGQSLEEKLAYTE